MVLWSKTTTHVMFPPRVLADKDKSSFSVFVDQRKQMIGCQRGSREWQRDSGEVCSRSDRWVEVGVEPRPVCSGDVD